jgi:hypothetical protein
MEFQPQRTQFSCRISQMEMMVWLNIPKNDIKFEIILKVMIY